MRPLDESRLLLAALQSLSDGSPIARRLGERLRML
jgi:hypothetical protein